MAVYAPYGQEDSEERKYYSSPSLAELGTVAALTMGDGTSEIWDIGPGRKEE